MMIVLDSHLGSKLALTLYSFCAQSPKPMAGTKDFQLQQNQGKFNELLGLSICCQLNQKLCSFVYLATKFDVTCPYNKSLNHLFPKYTCIRSCFKASSYFSQQFR